MNRARFLRAVGVVTAVASLATGLASAQTPPAAPQQVAATARANAFLSLDGVKGESTDASHRSWIEISSFSFGEAQNIGSATSGAGAGKVKFSDFSITKKVDSASPSLFQMAATGKHIKTAIVELTKAGSDGRTLVWYRVTLTDVIVTKAAVNPSNGGSRPTETVKFAFAAITVETAQRNADGSAGTYARVPDGWDIKANVRI